MKNRINESALTTSEKLMNVSELAEYLGFKLSRVRYEVFKGNICYLKIGRSIRFSKAQIDHWLASKQKGGSNE